MWTWQFSPLVENDFEHAAFNSGWRLFKLSQHLGLTADDIQRMQKSDLLQMLKILDEFTATERSKVWLYAYEYHYRENFFQAIHAFHQTNDEISAAAISLYPNVDRKYPELIPLLEYGVGKYFHYDNTGDFYKGSPGDRSAGLVRHLARQYQNAGRDTDAVNVMAIYMAVREADTNGHLQQLLSLEMAKSLDAMGQPAQADRLLSYALSTYQGSWNEKIIAQRSALRQKLGLFERLPAATLYIAAAALLFLLAGAFQFVRRRTA